MYTKVLSLGLIASIIASASARSIYSTNNALDRRSSLVDLSGNTVVLDHTVSDTLNNLAVVGNANDLTAAVIAEESGRSSGRGPSRHQSEAESEISEDLEDEFQKRSSLISASCNKVIAKDTVSNVANGATVTDNLNKLTAKVLARRSSVVDASGNVVSLKKTVHNVGNGITAADNVNNAVAKVINTRDTVGVKGTNVRLTDTASNVLNGVVVTDTADDAHVDVLKRDGVDDVVGSVEDTIDGISNTAEDAPLKTGALDKRDVIGVKGNNVVTKNTVNDVLNGAEVSDVLNSPNVDVL